MSKRFGRRQKRKMRETNAALQESCQKLESKNRFIELSLGEIEDDIEDLFGKNTSLLKAKTIPWHASPPPSIDMMYPMHRRITTVDEELSHRVYDTRITLQRLRAVVNRDEARRCQHVLVSCNGSEVRYYVADRTLVQGGRNVAIEIGKQVANELLAGSR